ncbi:uncharacterized protein LOC119603042 [Lucilia sericata]|uniref:uncharacterized protein LOC119603042 n=1 Tax=Lucilia sericata TaxID=13632 RepID=UPI0018A7EAE6|nr:uncharacterized protein LOC119603042 [Lucilia sericata]
MALRRKCKLDLHHLISYITSWEEATNENIHVSLLEIKRDELDKRWSKLTESYDNYMLEEDKGVTEDFKDDISIRYEEVSIKYDQIKSQIINMIKEQNENSNQERSYNRESRFRLPPCDMQNFDGGVSKWPAFRDMSQAVCANKTDMAPAEKLFYLRSKLRGEAFQTIKHLDLVDENFSIAWEALKNRYENVRVLVHQQMKQLFGMPTIPQENAKAMRHMQSLVHDCISILKSFSVDVANCHPFLIYLCYSKLPDETVRAWETTLANHKILPTWQQMRFFN